jgi:RNA polymerase sigma-70 factor, ECF subfamily
VPVPGEATLMLMELNRGESAAAARLMPLVYGELRALASDYFRGQRPDQTLQPTALVHEAYLKLVDQSTVAWKDRAHFFAVAATAMRQVLIDRARRRAAQKRGGKRERLQLEDADTPARAQPIDLVALDDALRQLESLDARMARIVELRFFGGLGVDETARVLGVSTSTVEADWRGARAWLAVELGKA